MQNSVVAVSIAGLAAVSASVAMMLFRKRYRAMRERYSVDLFRRRGQEMPAGWMRAQMIAYWAVCIGWLFLGLLFAIPLIESLRS